MKSPLIFDIGKLLSRPTGTSETFTVKVPVKFPEIEIKSDLKGKVSIMRLDDGFNVVAKNFDVKISVPCEKCLKKYSQNVEIPFAERFFHLDPPKKIEDPNDTFIIDKKNRTLDALEMLRQEIILHFPVNLVCSYHCKGICPVCGKDLNKGKCECKIEKIADTLTYKPFAGLKEMLKPKRNNHGKTRSTKEKNR